MKYIKTFEGRKPNKIRKYIVLRNYITNNDDNYLIFLIKKNYVSSLNIYTKTLNLLYIYYINNNDLSTDKNINRVIEEYDDNIIDENLLYTSDNLQDIINNLPLIVNQNKYNL